MLMRLAAVVAAFGIFFVAACDVALANLQQAVAQSKQSGKPLLVVVSGEG